MQLRLAQKREVRFFCQCSMNFNQRMYAIVEFSEEGTCEMVPDIWLFMKDEVQYCYWPPMNATKKVQKIELPDKENWAKHRVRVFAKTDDYERAKQWSKKAAVQSSLESCDDSPKGKDDQCVSAALMKTHHLCLVGGPNPGENTRRVMRAVASYGVWKEFSLKGKKVKRPLQNLIIMKILIKAVMRSNPGIQQAKVEDIVADTLKHTPARCQNSVF
ncbi:uncharacterized protein LOC113078146 [Carassius auratus]|uniref:Uncharacterized protein LOC113078146 n=1 Tax=Carassius auratus TaxID=7957 RepID=A0A6P6NDI4_CARAU|nr:uncharacterized protein LOC113078146 [Carassius auratus]